MNYATLYAGPETMNDNAWYPDSSATNHVTADATNLMQKTKYHGPEQVHVGNGKGLAIKHIGNSSITSFPILLKLSN